ncbi:MAG: flagellar protein [Devosia nanyangense]|uniref:Flagellin n=1 Tax=Devosia nanyangense TaxID=1228055 RepID=A0A933KZB6_9HYPH|nr:flagellar protein [Devosia nanyangense]
MSAVTLSQAVRTNLLSLQNTASLLDVTQTRLATGNKVNSALDNPTSYFTAASLNSRAGDLGNLLDSVSNAVQTIQAANDGITSITKLVESAQATANQAQQLSETVGTGGQAAVTGSVAIGADTTASVTGTSSFAGYTILADGSGFSGTSLTLQVNGSNITFDFYNSAGGATPYTGSNIGIDTDDGTGMSPQPLTLGLAAMQAGLRASGVFGTADATVGLDASNHLEITLGTDTTSNLTVISDTTAGLSGNFGFTTGQTGTPNSALGLLSGTLTIGSDTFMFGSGLGEINSRAELLTSLATLSGGITASIDGSNHLTLTGSGSSAFAVGGTLDVNAAVGIAEQNYTAGGANPARAALVTQYNGLLDQIDQLTKDAGYNGNNLLAGSSTTLKVVFNETGTSSLTITGKDTSATGLGLAQLSNTSFDANSAITAILGNLKTATDTLRADASSFGSNLSIVQTRQDFTKALINTLQTGASNLTLADSNEEAANLLALQTRQSLSTKALSLASQSDQNVLRLLQ